MAASPDTMVAYIHAALKVADKVILYFGSHQVAVKDVYREEAYPGLLICTTINDLEMAVMPAAILAAKAEDDDEGELEPMPMTT